MKRTTVLLIAVFMLLCSCAKPSANNEKEIRSSSTPIATPSAQTDMPTHVSGDRLISHFIDVGQGDCEFIELPNGKCMLIDAGERNCAEAVISYINKLKYKKLDYVVVTHAHSDHMGGMNEVIRSFDVGRIFMPKAGNNTLSYEKLLQAVSDKGLKIKAAKAGVTVCSDEGLLVELIAPVRDYDDLNNTSAVVKITFGDNVFLYMGDAESESESDITADVSCDVCKVGHHGSNSSSTADFVSRTHAKYAVISVGADNSYGHPKEKVIKRWESFGAQILRTDILGTIVITGDGKAVSVSNTKQTGTAESVSDDSMLILNTNTMKIHRSDCEHVKEINPANIEETTQSVEELIRAGYSRCKTCNP